ncbi:MAG: hypothetical protein M1839_000721 [Geoglossum umbratile]|nr:MAG: hypothetical protein M1839_000721 [Geoglossum umbratile]
MCTLPFKESIDQLIKLPEDKLSAFEDFFIWLHSYEPRIPAKADPLIDLAILADKYQICLLKNQISDEIRTALSQGRWRITPDMVCIVYASTPTNSILRRLFSLGFMTGNGGLVEFSPYGSSEKWKSVFSEFSELGWDYFYHIQMDASLDLRRSLSEEYSNSISFSDGEIYQIIRCYKLHTDRSIETTFAEMRWWARLKGKRKDLKMLFTRRNFTDAFDKLLVIPGIWGGLRIGMLHKILALRCDKELLQYLEHILTTTVKALQLKAPGYSKEDLATIEPHFRTDELFSAVRSPADRQNIWNNLRQVEGLIPTIESFFEDFKYLAPTARIVSRLFPKKKRITVYEEMYRIFSKRSQKDGEVIVQDSDKTFYIRTGNSTDQFEFGYWQVWLYAWHHFPKLIEECPRKENGQPTPVPQEPSKYRWHELASLANKLGFQSEQINQLMSIDPFMEIAHDALLKAQGLDGYEYEEATFEPYQGQIANIVKTATTRATTTRQPMYKKPALLVDGSGEALERRCGRTFENAYRNDWKFLFLDVLYDPVPGEGKGISSFYVRSSVYFAFFGRYISSSSTNTIPHQEDDMSPHHLETQPQSQGDGPQDEQPQNIPSVNITSPNREQMITMSTSNEMETTQEASNAIVPYRDQQELEEDTEMEIHRKFFKIWENNTLVDQRISTEMDRPQVEHYLYVTVQKQLYLSLEKDSNGLVRWLVLLSSPVREDKLYVKRSLKKNYKGSWFQDHSKIDRSGLYSYSHCLYSKILIAILIDKSSSANVNNNDVKGKRGRKRKNLAPEAEAEAEAEVARMSDVPEPATASIAPWRAPVAEMY